MKKLESLDANAPTARDSPSSEESELEPFLRREVEDEAQGPGCAATTQSDRHLIRAVPPLPCDELIGEEKAVLDVQDGRRSVQGGAGFNAPISNRENQIGISACLWGT